MHQILMLLSIKFYKDSYQDCVKYLYYIMDGFRATASLRYVLNLMCCGIVLYCPQWIKNSCNAVCRIVKLYKVPITWIFGITTVAVIFYYGGWYGMPMYRSRMKPVTDSNDSKYIRYDFDPVKVMTTIHSIIKDTSKVSKKVTKGDSASEYLSRFIIPSSTTEVSRFINPYEDETTTEVSKSEIPYITEPSSEYDTSPWVTFRTKYPKELYHEKVTIIQSLESPNPTKSEEWETTIRNLKLPTDIYDTTTSTTARPTTKPIYISPTYSVREIVENSFPDEETRLKHGSHVFTKMTTTKPDTVEDSSSTSFISKFLYSKFEDMIGYLIKCLSTKPKNNDRYYYYALSICFTNTLTNEGTRNVYGEFGAFFISLTAGTRPTNMTKIMDMSEHQQIIVTASTYGLFLLSLLEAPAEMFFFNKQFEEENLRKRKTDRTRTFNERYISI